MVVSLLVHLLFKKIQGHAISDHGKKKNDTTVPQSKTKESVAFSGNDDVA